VISSTAVHPQTAQQEEDMDPKKTALVLIEYQNDFTSKGGTLHDAVKGVMEQNNMLQNTVETVS
jgi:nicotinamidase-related amidase